ELTVAGLLDLLVEVRDGAAIILRSEFLQPGKDGFAGDPLVALLLTGLIKAPHLSHSRRVGLADLLDLRLVKLKYGVIAALLERAQQCGDRRDALVQVLGPLSGRRCCRQPEAAVTQYPGRLRQLHHQETRSHANSLSISRSDGVRHTAGV